MQPLTQEVLPEGFTLLPLPGHFFDMGGVRTPDDVVYLADCLSSRETLEKYQIGFVYDVAAYLETLERVKTMQAKWFVPSHAEAGAEIRAPGPVQHRQGVGDRRADSGGMQAAAVL